MGILKKVKNLVGAEESATEAAAKKPRAKKAVSSDAAPKKPRAKKAAPAEVAAHDHDHDHDHAGHDHAHEHAGAEVKPESVAGAVGVGAVKYVVRPLITEKGALAGEHNTYLFQVAIAANKSAIKQAIEKLYGVSVTKVRTIRQDGKVVRYGRTQGRRSNFKKAYVTIAKGQSITVYKGV